MDSAEMMHLLARTLARAPVADQGSAVVRLCDACTKVAHAPAGVLSLASAGERMTVRSSGFPPAFAQIEDLQLVLGEGPAELALAEGRVVAGHLGGPGADSGSFPVFASMAATVDGTVSIYAVPMHRARRVVGVLTLYLKGRGSSRTPESAQLLADAAGTALSADPDGLGAGSQPSPPRWVRMHRATGVVVAQLGVAAADALAVLRAHAFGRASTLDSVVTDVLERRLSFSCGDGPGTGRIVERHTRTGGS